MNQLEVKRIVAELLPFIRFHRLKSGDRLPSERDLCKRFNANRNTVREALTALEIVRVVERRPNSGVYLRSLSRDTSVDAMAMFQDAGIPLLLEEVIDFVETRRILEIESLKLAIDRRSEEDLRTIMEILEDGKVSVIDGEAFAKHDAAFHLALVECAHNQVYLRLVNSFYLTSRQRRIVYFKSATQCQQSLGQHIQLFEALRDRDCERALIVLDAHLQSVEKFWSRQINDITGVST